MDLFKAIYNRRSIRKYNNRDVSDDAVQKILKAGMFAPSAVNKQPWHFIVFRNQETKVKISEVHPNASMLPEANLGILVCWDNNLAHGNGLYGPVDCSASTQNILLAAHGLGIGAVWLGVYPREDRMKSLHEAFQLPENIIPFSVVALGYYDEEIKQPQRFREDKIHLENW